MAKALTTTRASVTAYDLTGPPIKNDGKHGEATTIETGDTWMYNEIDFTNEVGSSRIAIDANAGSSSVGVANIFKVLKVPPRTVVHEVWLYVPDGATAGPTCNDGGTVGAGAVLNFSFAAYKSASLTTIKGDVLGGFGTLAVNASTNAVTYFPTVSASTPWTRTAKLLEPTVTNAVRPAYYPYGGYVEMQFSGGASTQSVTSDVYFSGRLGVMAKCSRMPE